MKRIRFLGLILTLHGRGYTHLDMRQESLIDGRKAQNRVTFQTKIFFSLGYCPVNVFILSFVWPAVRRPSGCGPLNLNVSFIPYNFENKKNIV